MDTQTQIERLIELAIVQRTELKELVAQLPQLREHLSTEIEKAFDEAEPQLRAELEEWTTKQAADKTAALGVTLEAKIADLAKSLEVSTQARYNAIIAEREQNARIAADAEAKIAEHAASLPGAVKEIVSAELARFPRAGEIEQLRKEFAEPRGLNPRGKWQAGESYNKLDFVTINGDSYTSNIDNNRTRPSRSSADWTLVAARGTGGGGGPTSLSELTTVPSDGDVLIGSGTSWVTSNLTAGAGISITVGPGAITISATDGDITLDDGTAASPSLHFTNDPDTGIYRPAANTLGISVSGTQVAYFDENGLTVPSAGVVAGGSIHAGNGNANNPSLSFDGDQDTGFFRHQPNEIGIALGGTQYATLTSTTFSIVPVVTMASSLRVNGTTDSTNKDTGAIVTEGGLGVEKSATIGGNLTLSGATSTITLGSTNTATIAGDASGGLTVTPKAGQVLTVSVSGNSGTSINNGTTQVYLGNSGDRAVVGTLNGYDFSILRNGAVGLTVGATGITVSGTGTSSFAGKIQSSVATATGYNQLYDTTGITTGRGAFAITSTGAGLAFGIEASVGGTSFTGSTAYASYFGTTTATPIHFVTNAAISATLTSGGNFLIGTTTDGGQKLQVSGTSNFSNPGSSTIANFTNSANADFQIVLTASTSAKIGPSTPTSLILQTNGTTALTLDSSQNATFAGTVTANGGGPHTFGAATGSITLGGVSGYNVVSVNATNSISGTTIGIFGGAAGDPNLYLNAKTGGGAQVRVNNVTALTVNSTTTTISGALRLGNAYTAGAPTATGYVTIQDSAGNTYKVLVGT